MLLDIIGIGWINLKKIKPHCETRFLRSGSTGIRTPNQRIMSTQFIENDFHTSAEVIMYL